MSDATEAINEQAQRQRDDDTVVVVVDCSHDEFRQIVMPYAIGYMGNTHGLTSVQYGEKRMVFQRLDDA